MGPMKSDPNKRLIPLTVSPLSGAHCIINSLSKYLLTNRESYLLFNKLASFSPEPPLLSIFFYFFFRVNFAFLGFEFIFILLFLFAEELCELTFTRVVAVVFSLFSETL